MNLVKSGILAFGIIVSAGSGISQGLLNPVPEGYANYVPNPGFETTTREYCRWNQNGREYMESVAHWDSPTETTPDILSLRAKRTCWSNPMEHSGGKQSPRNGDNMAGMKIYGKGGTETFWHEYLMVQLDSALIPGVKYYAEFFTSRAVSCDRGANNLGMAFTDTAMITRDRMPLFIHPAVYEADVVKSRWNAWKKISGVFEVDTERSFLIIGNFYHDEDTKITESEEGKGGAYYYIDDVMVRRALPTEGLTPVPPAPRSPRPKIILEKAEIVTTKEIKLDSIDYRPGNIITLENIFFEFDKATLLPESKTELMKVVDILSDYPHMKIEIQGHTDNVGADAYNQKLSEARAASVVEFLKSEDVQPERLSYKGYGSKSPLVGNESEAGRAINRRVAFIVMSN